MRRPKLESGPFGSVEGPAPKNNNKLGCWIFNSISALFILWKWQNQQVLPFGTVGN
jgi:hypothetical protein